jgi:phage terminase small subunit
MEQLEAGKSFSMDQLDLMRRERLALSKLTDKQKKFCEVYVTTFDRVLAMQEGGYSLPKHRGGGSQIKLIDKTFNNIMRSPAVAEYINLLKQSVASRIGVSMDQIIEEYRRLAFANMADYVSWDNNGVTFLKSSDDLTAAQKAGVVEVVETTTKSGKTVRIKLHSKQASLDRLFEVLKELEVHDTGEGKAAKISQTQINIMLADPAKRRALEHLSEAMYDKRILLTSQDKNKDEFNKQLDKITMKLLGNAHGISGTGPAGVPQLTAGQTSGGEDGDTGDHGETGETENGFTETHNQAQGGPQGAEGDQEQALPEEERRYDIDGL